MDKSDATAAEHRARCDLLAARDAASQAKRLEQAIFESYITASELSAAAAKREDDAFYIWYAASKARDDNLDSKPPTVAALSDPTGDEAARQLAAKLVERAQAEAIDQAISAPIPPGNSMPSDPKLAPPASAQEASGAKTIAGLAMAVRLHMVSALAMKRGPSVDFCGYWQRHLAA